MDQVPAPAHHLCRFHREQARAHQGLPPEAPTVDTNQASIFDFMESSSEEDDDDAKDSLTRYMYQVPPWLVGNQCQNPDKHPHCIDRQ